MYLDLISAQFIDASFELLSLFSLISIPSILSYFCWLFLSRFSRLHPKSNELCQWVTAPLIIWLMASRSNKCLTLFSHSYPWILSLLWWQLERFNVHSTCQQSSLPEIYFLKFQKRLFPNVQLLVTLDHYLRSYQYAHFSW